MKKNVVMYVVAAIAMMLGATTVLLAQTPPPVPQTFGIYDAKFTTFTTAECRGCHSSGVPDRHHNLIYTKGKACLDCHTLVSDGLTPPSMVFADFRTCSVCHKTSPHHTTAAAAARDCKACHGPIDNPLDGHYVPTYPVSSVTPRINGIPAVDPATGAIVTVQGCAACHQPNATAIDPNTNLVRAISSNADTHHGTNLGQPGSTVGNCDWCHNFAQPGLAIRQCESCHGVKSLHNIQPKVGGAPVPGGEPAGLGHIGNNWDCQGCHVSWFGKGLEETTPAAIIPGIRGNSYSLPANKEAVLTLNGVAFTNTLNNGTIYNPTVLIKTDTISLTLTPLSFTNSEIQVTVPALLEGNYNIYVSKGTGTAEVRSNVAKLVVSQPVFIKTAIASNNTVTISGSDFGSAPPTDYKSGMGVFAGTTQGKIVSWSANKIVATIPGIKAGNQVTVKTLRGPVSAVVLEAAKKSR